MSPIKHVTGTAFVVAEFRARENEEPHPLYVDRVVPIFLDAADQSCGRQDLGRLRRGGNERQAQDPLPR